MNRNLFFEKVTVDGVVELDFLDNSLHGFEIKRQPTYYRVRQDDLIAPDNISKKTYATEKFWWFILIVNNIQDVKEDLYMGQILSLPHILDIYDYYKLRRKR